jgi:hypothetical protein
MPMPGLSGACNSRPRRAILRSLRNTIGKCAISPANTGLALPGAIHSAEKVAKCVDHANQAQPGEQKNQRMAQRQVVVDGAGEHRNQGEGKDHPGARRQNENAPLGQTKRSSAVALPAKQVLFKASQQAHESGNGNAANQAGDIF